MELETWQLAFLSILGVIAGILNVIAGGGSLLTLPAMVLMGLPGPVANGTNRVAILAQNVSAVTGFRKKGFSDFKLSLTLALCALPGSIAGAYVGTLVRGKLFNTILAVIIFTGWQMRRFNRVTNLDRYEVWRSVTPGTRGPAATPIDGHEELNNAFFREPGDDVRFGEVVTVSGEATQMSRARIQAHVNVGRGEFERDEFASGSTSELAARGLYGDYALFLPAGVLSTSADDDGLDE